jgi:hypothetical protein
MFRRIDNMMRLADERIADPTEAQTHE